MSCQSPQLKDTACVPQQKLSQSLLQMRGQSLKSLQKEQLKLRRYKPIKIGSPNQAIPKLIEVIKAEGELVLKET